MYECSSKEKGVKMENIITLFDFFEIWYIYILLQIIKYLLPHFQKFNFQRI